MCFMSVKLDRPMKGAPSPPIWAKVRVFGPSSSAMKWQPMPALAKLPSGSLVEVACGHPAQNAGMRRSRPSGRSTASAPEGPAGSSRRGRGTCRGRRPRFQATVPSMVKSAAAPRGSVLPLTSGRSSGGQMVQGVADLAFDETALLLDDQDQALAAGEITSPSVSSGQVMPTL